MTTEPEIPGVPPPAQGPRPSGIVGRPGDPWWQRDLRVLAAVVSAGVLIGVLAGPVVLLTTTALASLNPGRELHLRWPLGASVDDPLLFLLVVVAGTIAAALVVLAVRSVTSGRGAAVAAIGVPSVLSAALLLDVGLVEGVPLVPAWLTLVVFLGVPLIGAWLLAGVIEHLTPWFARGSPWKAVLALPVVLAVPLLPVVLATAALRAAVVRSRTVHDALGSPAARRLWQVAIGTMSLIALADVMAEVAALL